MSDGSLLDRVRPHLLTAPPYVPVQPPEALAERLGIPVEGIIKVDANESPYGPSPKALDALADYRSYHIYPDPEQRRLRRVLADYVGVTPDMVLPGAGSDEAIELCVRMFVPEQGAILNFPPTFGMYTFLADVLVGNQCAINVLRRPDFSLDIESAREAADRAHLIFAVSPNNPTGTLLQPDELEALLSTGLPVVVDEAYAEFSGRSYVGLVAHYPNLIVLRTLSKWAGLAGLRVGYMIADPAIIDLAMRIKQPYSVNVAGEIAALASFEDLPLLQERIERIVRERERIEKELACVPGFTVAPSSSNFVLCEIEGIEAKAVYEALEQRGIMVRYFENALLRNHVRITAGKPDHNDAVLAALHDITTSPLAKEGARA